MIRAPRPEDKPRILELLRKMHVETAFSAFSLSEERLESQVSAFLDPEEGYFGLVFERDGEVQGVFFGHADQLWFSDALCGFDDVFYVQAESRGRYALPVMLRLFETWCRRKGCEAVLVGVSSGVMVDRTGKMLERLGYGRLGGLYRRHV